jgi:hypothetical protein
LIRRKKFKAIINTGMDTLGLTNGVKKWFSNMQVNIQIYHLNGDAGLFKDNYSCSSEQ